MDYKKQLEEVEEAIKHLDSCVSSVVDCVDGLQMWLKELKGSVKYEKKPKKQEPVWKRGDVAFCTNNVSSDVLIKPEGELVKVVGFCDEFEDHTVKVVSVLNGVERLAAVANLRPHTPKDWTVERDGVLYRGFVSHDTERVFIYWLEIKSDARGEAWLHPSMVQDVPLMPEKFWGEVENYCPKVEDR